MKILLFNVIKPEITLETHDSRDLVCKTKHWLLLEPKIKTILVIWNQPCPSRATEISVVSQILASRNYYGVAYIELLCISFKLSSALWKKLQLIFQKTSQIDKPSCLPTQTNSGFLILYGLLMFHWLASSLSLQIRFSISAYSSSAHWRSWAWETAKCASFWCQM